MKKIILLLLFIFSCQVRADLYRAKHDGFIKKVIPGVHKVLISKNICKDYNDCSKKKLLFFGPGKEVLYLSLYSVEDLEVIKDVIDEILSAYKEDNASTSIKLLAYKENYPVNVNLFKKIFTKNEPFLIMSIEEK